MTVVGDGAVCCYCMWVTGLNVGDGAVCYCMW